MASGIERCMYCEDSKGNAIEHFWPKRDYPDRAFDWLNYLLACTECNSNFKRTRFPLDARGEPLLLDPTDPCEDPLDHLLFSPDTGRFEPVSQKGRESEEIFGLNRASLLKGRRNAWILLRKLLPCYDQCKTAGLDEEAAEIELAVREQPFSAVFAAVLRIASKPGAELMIGTECIQILQKHPEIATWL